MSIPVKTVANFRIGNSDGVFLERNGRVVALANGQFDVSWVDDRSGSFFDSSIKIERFDADGTAANGGRAIVPGTPSITVESNTGLATLNGAQVVVVAERSAATGDGVIRLTLYSDKDFAAGAPAARNVVVDTSPGAKYGPELVALAGGRLAVVYVDDAAGLVKARVYDPKTSAFTGASVTLGANPSWLYDGDWGFRLGTTALADGGFAVSWLDNAGISHLRLLDKAGAPRADDIALADATRWTTLTQLQDGRLLLCAEEHWWFVLRIVDPVTGVAGPPIATGEQGCHPEILALQDGRALMVWADNDFRIMGRIVDADGHLNEHFVIADTDTELNRPSVTELADGRVVVTYDELAVGGVYATVLDPRIAGVTVIGTEGADQYVGSAYADKLYGRGGVDHLVGGGGDDLLNGGTGADVMTGGDGDDTYVVDNAGDRTVEAANGGIDTVQASISWTLTDGVENLRLTGSADLSGTGNAGDNIIRGNAGNNVLSGGGGADTLIGGLGNDTYLGVDGDDRIVERVGEGFDTILTDAKVFTLRAGTEVELVSTTSLAGSGVTLTGNEFGQTLRGSAVHGNVLDGKGGADLLIGGAGSDVFVFSTALGPGNIDHIERFGNGPVENDSFRFAKSVFTALDRGQLSADEFIANADGEAKHPSDHIIYETDTGNLYYDADGTGPAAPVHFATIDSLSGTLSAADFFVF